MDAAQHSQGLPAPTDAAHWYKDAIIYELHVRSFYDANGDGVGDFQGLISRLDYLRDLGVTALWLLPFYPSPLRDDGYDIAGYTAVNPMYGTLADFKRFMREAHRRGLRVITELVINHTSSDHPWFQRARRAPEGSTHRNFYVWSDTPERYRDARIIFPDFEASNWTWDPIAKAYYWHRFFHHQPDLNFESAAVRKAIMHIVDFWLGLGVDGMRLDAVPYLYEREGTTCENLPPTHEYLRSLRAHIDEHFGGRMLLAEANQWPDDAAAYFGRGDECHMNFHFSLMPRLFMAIRLEDSFPIIDILRQTPDIPAHCQWAMFLRNHDELTLEMVTDEDRDYMYRVYAEDTAARINLGIRRRLAPLVRSRQQRELLHGLLLSLPGTPVVYYGDEIGMGDNIYLGDRNGVRTPMQWSADRNAGFSRANPQRLVLPPITDPAFHYEAVNVELQQNNPTSFLWWFKRIIALRKQCPAFGRGTLTFVDSDNPKVLAYIRSHEDQHVLVAANLSRVSQSACLNLRGFVGRKPVELFGSSSFPPITQEKYFLSFGRHGFYWFALTGETAHAATEGQTNLPLLKFRRPLHDVLASEQRASLEDQLVEYLPTRHWFRAKAKGIDHLRIVDVVTVEGAGAKYYWTVIEVELGDSTRETYVVPLVIVAEPLAEPMASRYRGAEIARVQVQGRRPATADGEVDHSGVLCDASVDEGFRSALFEFVRRRRSSWGAWGGLHGYTTRVGKPALKLAAGKASRVLDGEPSHTSMLYGDLVLLKTFRRLDEGENLELKVTQYLANKGFERVPPILGWLEYTREGKPSACAATLHAYIPNQGDSWSLTLSALGSFFERALAHGPLKTAGEARMQSGASEDWDIDPAAREIIGPYLPFAALLGERTAELHDALIGDANEPDFAPEKFTALHQRSLYQTVRMRWLRTLASLEALVAQQRAPANRAAMYIIEQRAQLEQRMRSILGRSIAAQRMRIHGDFHLGQVLYSGGDFVFTDFEGEPDRSPGERRIKRSPLVDIASMLRSFDYVLHVAVHGGASQPRPEDREALEPWLETWRSAVAHTYVRAYLQHLRRSDVLPANHDDRHLLLDFCLLEKCIYELSGELNNRPDWIDVPLAGLARMLEHGGGSMYRTAN